jgi:hypothetical protein
VSTWKVAGGMVLVSGLVACSSGPLPTPEESADAGVLARDVGVRPSVVQTTPALGAKEVYPSPYGDGVKYRVEIAVQFSAEMDTGITELPFGPKGEALPMHPVIWAVDARSLVVAVSPPPLAPQILTEGTLYELDLSGLTDVVGQPLARDVGLEDGSLLFTTGSYDPLLNHSCGHTVFGPFDNGVASSESPPVFIASATHTQYALSFIGSDEREYAGIVGLQLATAGSYRLYFDGFPGLSIVRATSDERESVTVEPTPRSCAGISGQLDVEVAADELLELHAQPNAPLMYMIVESLTQ